MNKTEHLLTCLAEECAEVQQAVSKALRFGLHDGHPQKGITNAEDIAHEFIDVIAVMEMLVDTEVIKLPANRLIRTEQKKQRVDEYMLYAERRGTLKSDKPEGDQREYMFNVEIEGKTNAVFDTADQAVRYAMSYVYMTPTWFQQAVDMLNQGQVFRYGYGFSVVNIVPVAKRRVKGNV